MSHQQGGVTTEQLERLHDFFAPHDIHWKPFAVSKKTGKALAGAYADNRAIMDRLDVVCGAANWCNEFRPGPDGGIICGLSIFTEARGWVTKWDGAENTDVEAVKGGLSSAMRRAANQWGIGRYLYAMPQEWIAIDDRGRLAKKGTIRDDFLPPEYRKQQQEPKNATRDLASADDRLPQHVQNLLNVAGSYGLTTADVLVSIKHYVGHDQLGALSPKEADAMITRIEERYESATDEGAIAGAA